MKVVYKPYRYVKADPLTPKPRFRKPSVSMGQMFAIFCLFIGVGIFGAVLFPVITWQLTSSQTKSLVEPVSQNDGGPAVLGISDNGLGQNGVQLKKLSDGFSYFSAPASSATNRQGLFILEIPKIGIKTAKIIANTNDFDTHLGHLPGSAFPGEVGNVFVTGHSALPAFYSPTNYKTIFTDLPKLDVLDDIIVHMGNRSYYYSIEKTSVVDPSDVSVIYPPDAFGKYLTLMTCVPPGMNTKRLIVLARLME